MNTGKRFLVEREIEYEDVLGLHPLFNALAFRGSLLLVGPKGIGKSLSIAAWAKEGEVPLVTFDCAEDTRRFQLIGGFVPVGDTAKFMKGPVTTAIQIANEWGHCILNLEELNSLTPQTQKVLNGLLDWRNEVTAFEAEESFKLLPGKKLWVVASMNTASHGGVFQLNEDLKSRFRIKNVGYPEQADELSILKRVCAKYLEGDDGTIANFMDRVVKVAHQTRQKAALDYSLSTRDLVQLVEDCAVMGIHNSVALLLGKFDAEDRKVVQLRFEAVFSGESWT